MAAALASWARHERDEGLPPAQWRPRAERAAQLVRTLMALPTADLLAAMGGVNYPRGCLAKALVVLDELAEALPLLESLQQLYADQGNTYALFYVRLELARAWLQGGQADQARQLAHETIATLAEALVRADEKQPLSLLMIDLDHFKAVNDRDGHQRGDQALGLVGQTLQRCCRALDTAARIGGDEFALLGTMEAAVAQQVADRLREALRADSLLRWPDRAPLTLSIGLATTCIAAAPDTLLHRADTALYAAKAAGRDTVRAG